MTKSICVVGLGYIGLPTAVMFANHGVKVHGVDVNPAAVKSIQEKQLHIEENGLQERLKIHQMERENERLRAENLLLKKLEEIERRYR